jgi:DNA-binding transcriptional LysR family regulator
MSRLPDLQAWAIFAKVVETGSFSRAAADLSVSKATISKAVQRLEARIGAPLLNRTSRRLALTETGRDCAASAARIVAEAETAEAEASRHSSEASGTVRIAAPMSFGITYVGPALPDLLRKHPKLSVDLNLSDERVDLIGGGFDLALRIATLADSTLRARRICRVPLHLIAAPAYLKRRGRPEHPSALERHDCVGYAYAATPDRLLLVGPGGERVTVAPRGPLRANNGDALIPTVLAGLAIGVAPEFLIWRALRSGQLVEAIPGWAPPPVALNLVTPPGTLRSARVRVTMDFFAARFATAPWAGADGEPGSGAEG